MGNIYIVDKDNFNYKVYYLQPIRANSKLHNILIQ